MITAREVLKIQKEFKENDERLPILFDVLGDSRRFPMFKLLMTHHGLCVTEIAKVFNISTPAASQHLRVLEMAGLIEKERMGQMTCYKIRKRNPLTRRITKIFGLKGRAKLRS